VALPQKRDDRARIERHSSTACARPRLPERAAPKARRARGANGSPAKGAMGNRNLGALARSKSWTRPKRAPQRRRSIAARVGGDDRTEVADLHRHSAVRSVSGCAARERDAARSKPTRVTFSGGIAGIEQGIAHSSLVAAADEALYAAKASGRDRIAMAVRWSTLTTTEAERRVGCDPGGVACYASSSPAAPCPNRGRRARR
jgi:hypothetical protein